MGCRPSPRARAYGVHLALRWPLQRVPRRRVPLQRQPSSCWEVSSGSLAASRCAFSASCSPRFRGGSPMKRKTKHTRLSSTGCWSQDFFRKRNSTRRGQISHACGPSPRFPPVHVPTHLCIRAPTHALRWSSQHTPLSVCNNHSNSNERTPNCGMNFGTKERTKELRNELGNFGTNERTNELEKELGNERPNFVMNFGTSKLRANELRNELWNFGTLERTNFGTLERTNERRSERTNFGTNERTNERRRQPFTIYLRSSGEEWWTASG